MTLAVVPAVPDHRPRGGGHLRPVRPGRRAHLPRLGPGQLRPGGDRDLRRLHRLRRPAGRAGLGDLARDRRRGAGRRRGVAGVPGVGPAGPAQRGGHRPGHRHHRAARPPPGHRPEALRRRQPAGRPLSPRRPLRLGRHRRPAGADLPRRHHARRHGRALGLDPVHPGRPGHQRQRPERAGGADPRVVPRPPGRAHLDDRRDARRVRRRPRRAAHRPVGGHLHDRGHRRRAGGRPARRLPLVPAHPGRRPDHRRGRGDGHPLQGATSRTSSTRTSSPGSAARRRSS